jgi:ribonuclease HIII
MTLVYTSVNISDLDHLKTLGYVKTSTKSHYELLRLKKNESTIILYSSGKLVVQAKGDDQSKIEKEFSKFLDLEREAFPHKEEVALKQNVIGSDEVLKGDTFGGLVLGAFYCKEEDVAFLQKLGVKDSKELTDEKISFISQRVLEEFPSQCQIYELFPKDYNDILSINTLTSVLNDAHTYLGNILKRKFPNVVHVVDKFPGCTSGDVAVVGAEKKYIAVATASILARAKALEQFETLSERAGFKLPMGSTHVSEALKKIRELKLNPKEFCKISFKNVENAFKEKEVKEKKDDGYF